MGSSRSGSRYEGVFKNTLDGAGKWFERNEYDSFDFNLSGGLEVTIWFLSKG